MQLNGPHINAEKLATILTYQRYPEETPRARVWEHLANGCDDCVACLEESLVASAGKDRNTDDPLIAALFDLALIRQPNLRDRLPLLLAAFAERCFAKPPFVPSAFRRVMLERAHQIARQNPGDTETVYRALNDLAEPNVTSFNGARDLRAVALAYHAEDLIANGGTSSPLGLPAEAILLEAAALNGDDGSPEARAAIVEVQAEQLFASGEHTQAIALLDEAVANAGHSGIPGRVVEPLLRLGRMQMLVGRMRAAARSFHDASRYLPEGTDVRLKTETLHRLADVRILLGEYSEALASLKDADAPSLKSGVPELTAQHQWLQGICYLQKKDLDKAEKYLMRALDGYRNLKLWDKALDALVQLGEVVRHTNRFDVYDELAHKNADLLASDIGHEKALQGLRMAAHHARAMGLHNDAILQQIERLESSP